MDPRNNFHLPCAFIVLMSFVCSSLSAQDPGGQSEPPDPCELLTDGIISEVFELNSAEISRNPSRYSPHPLCIATWPKANAAEIEAQQNELMLDYMKKKMSGEDVERPDVRTTNEISLTIYNKVFEDSEAAGSQFRSAMTYLSKDQAVEVEGKQYTSEGRKTIPVEGIGDQAAWVPSLNQLSVQSGRFVYHVGVILGKDPSVNLEKAKEMARLLSMTLE